MTYESLFAIDDEVKMASGNIGTIVAVRFTKMKVFYDVLDHYYGDIKANVASDYVYNKKRVTEDIGEAFP
jgi:hypothetical protein